MPSKSSLLLQEKFVPLEAFFSELILNVKGTKMKMAMFLSLRLYPFSKFSSSRFDYHLQKRDNYITVIFTSSYITVIFTSSINA